MKILLEIDGWKKEIEMDYSHVKTGYVKVGLFSPLHKLIHDPFNTLGHSKKKPIENIITIGFTYYGRKEGDLPIFTHLL